jgi:hypothetical protein
MSIISFTGVVMTKHAEFKPPRERLPLKVKHAMDRLDLDPPASPTKRFPDQITIIAMTNNELIAVLDIGILKRNLRDCPLEK